MDFNQLQYILSLNEKKSLAAVAEEFYTSHQSIKNSIKYLENELGIQLIISTKQGTELTEAGKCLYKYSLIFFDLFSELKQEINIYKDFDTEIKETINLYIAPMFATELYQCFFDEFEKNKNFSLNLNIYPAEKIVENVYNMSNSVGIFPMNLSEDRLQMVKDYIKKRNMELKVIEEIQIYAVVYKTSQFAKYEIILLDSIGQTPLFTFLNTNIFCGLKKVDNNIQYFNDFNLLKTLLKKTNGIGIIKKKEYDFFFGSKNTNFVLIPIKDAIVNYAMIYNKFDKNSKNIKEFIRNLYKFIK